MQDQGYDDYVAPDVAQYIACTRVVIQNDEYWLQLGCADGTSQALSVNIYSDNTCTTRSSVDGYDDSNIDTSELEVCTILFATAATSRDILSFFFLFCRFLSSIAKRV